MTEEMSENTTEQLVYAVIFTFLGGLLSVLGLILMKLSHNKHQALSGDQKVKRNPYCNSIWPTGFVSLIVGSVANVVALGFGNAILLSGSCSMSILNNSVLSILILNEKLHKNDAIAGILICGGSILFILQAKVSDQEFTEDELFALYRRPVAIVYIIVQIIYIAGALAVFYKFKSETVQFYKYCQQLSSKKDDENVPGAKALYFSVEMLDSSIFSEVAGGKFLKLKHYLKLPMLMLSLNGGVVAGVATSLLRGFTVSYQIYGLGGYTMLYLACALVFNITQLKSLNLAMEIYNSLDIVPIYQTALILFNMMGGAIILNEQAMYTWGELGILILCSLVCVAGVIVIVNKPKTDQKDEKVESDKMTERGETSRSNSQMNTEMKTIEKMKKQWKPRCLKNIDNCPCLEKQVMIFEAIKAVEEAAEQIEIKNQIREVLEIVAEAHSCEYHLIFDKLQNNDQESQGNDFEEIQEKQEKV